MLFYCRNKIYDLKKQIRYSCLKLQLPERPHTDFHLKFSIKPGRFDMGGGFFAWEHCTIILWRQQVIIIPGKEFRLSPEYFEVPNS